MNNQIMKKITSSVLLGTILLYQAPIFAYTKEETVYTKLNATGDPMQTLSSCHIINSEEDSIINDLSNLFHIKNVNGSEEFSISEEGNLIWNTNGNDIYYQGESDKALPVQCHLTYELDGEEISPQDLAGKSGKVKITLAYENLDEHLVNIQGKEEKMYTPFVVLCGTFLDHDHHRNIGVSNGKVIDDGSKSIVIGLALPGLRESLGLENSNLDIPSKVEITMDSTDFALGTIMNFITPKLIEASDVSFIDDLDHIYDKINLLQSAGNQLETGAKTLESGTNTYLEKSKEFNQAMEAVSNGMNSAYNSYLKIDQGIDTLNENANTLLDGAMQVSNGASAISNALGEVHSGASTLVQGSQSLSQNLNMIDTQLQTLTKNPNLVATELTDLITKTNEGIQELTAQEQNYQEQIAELESQLQDIQSSSLPNASTLEQDILLQIDTLTKLKNGTHAKIQALKSNCKLYQDLGKSLAECMANFQSTPGIFDDIANTVDQLSNGASQIASGTSALNSGISKLSTGAKELSTGAKSLYEGTASFHSGIETLNSGSKEMKVGLNTLNSSMHQLLNADHMLTSGAQTLSSGAKTLSSGMTQFNQEGIGAIRNYLGGNLEEFSMRLEKLQEFANEYDSFSSLSKEATGHVKFIIMIEGIQDAETVKEDVILNEKEKD